MTTRIAPDWDPARGVDPSSPAGLKQAEEDRLFQMSVYGLTEEDFGEEVIDAPSEDDADDDDE